MKLYSIKSEVRYTPKMILVKLVGSYTLSQLVIRITDIKRTKMVGVAYCLGAWQVSYPRVCVCVYRYGPSMCTTAIRPFRT